MQFWAKTVDLSVRLRKCQRGAVQNATKYHVAIPRTTRGLGNRSEPKAQKSSTSVLFERRKPPVSFSLRPYFWYGLLALLSLLLNAHVHRVRGWRNFAVPTFHSGANLSTGPVPVLGVRKPVSAVPLWILDYNSPQGPTPTQNSKGPLVQ